MDNMRMFKQVSLVILTIVCITACKPSPIDHAYLMTHPKALQKAIDRCQESGSVDEACAIVRRSAIDFSRLVEARSEDPEKFGQRILTAQQTVAELTMSLQKTQQALRAKPNDAELQKQLVNVQAAYASEQQAVNVLLAVVAQTTSFE